MDDLAAIPLVAWIAVALFGIGLVAIAAVIALTARRRAAAGLAEAIEGRLGELTRAQDEVSGRVRTMAEVFGSRQSELTRGLSERLDGLTHRLGQSMSEGARNTHESLRTLHERLVVIDEAQRNITTLSAGVVELQHILANKQTRGAFGQGRMETIVKDGLPQGGYLFQPTLSNGKRPDCLIRLPNDAPSLVIDAKFPLEAFNAIRNAATPDDKRRAEQQFRRDFGQHLNDIRDRYFVPGETQDTAFLFVPSESVFAELHERFEDVVERGSRLRVVVVSPSLLLLSIQVVQAVLRDARLREQAHLIRGEVGQLMQELGRLTDRVDSLQRHFTMAGKDVEMIVTSSGKLGKRGARLEELDFDRGGGQPEPETVVPLSARAAGS